MTTVRHLSTLAALALHAAGIGIAMSMPPGAPPAEPREIPITLTMMTPPEPPAPKVEESRPEPKPEPVVRETPPPVPQPVIEPPPEVIASAATSVAETVAPVMPPPPPPPPPPNPGAVKAQEDYNSRILAWLERHKRTPRTTRGQATAWVEFVFDRSGRLMDYKLLKSSGSPVLDEAALKMVQRSSPFPPVPKEIPGEKMSVQVPVEFTIR